MTAYELLFILLFLASAVSILTTVVLTVTRRRKAARNLLLSTASVWVVYLVVLFASDALSTQKVTKASDDVCFDEMCFAVVGVQRHVEAIPSSSSVTPELLYIVTMRMTSQSRGRPQAEGGLQGRLYQDGRYFAISEPAQQAYEAQHGRSPKLTQKLNPRDSILSVLVFKVPRDVTRPAITLDHGFTPGYFIIGESPFFHMPPIMELPPTDTASAQASALATSCSRMARGLVSPAVGRVRRHRPAFS